MCLLTLVLGDLDWSLMRSTQLLVWHLISRCLIYCLILNLSQKLVHFLNAYLVVANNSWFNSFNLLGLQLRLLGKNGLSHIFGVSPRLRIRRRLNAIRASFSLLRARIQGCIAYLSVA